MISGFSLSLVLNQDPQGGLTSDGLVLGLHNDIRLQLGYGLVLG